MKRKRLLTHEFVEYIPDDLKEGIIYISIQFATAVHKCCCGCGNEVVTPLSPTDWQLTFDGQSVSLHPSIGNWSFECNSHYLIIRNKVQWVRQLSLYDIKIGRDQDRSAKSMYYEKGNMTATSNDLFSSLGEWWHKASRGRRWQKPKK